MINIDLPAFDLPSLITVLRVIDVYTLFFKTTSFLSMSNRFVTCNHIMISFRFVLSKIAILKHSLQEKNFPYLQHDFFFQYSCPALYIFLSDTMGLRRSSTFIFISIILLHCHENEI